MKPFNLSGYLRAIICVLAAFLLSGSAFGQCVRTVNVSDNSELTSAVGSALPGDCIVLANGTYSGFTISRSGTPANPITIYAANQGAAAIASGILKFAGVSNVVIQGLHITTSGGSLTVDGTSRTVGVVLTNCLGCRITRCTFNLTGQASGTEWIFLGGNSVSNRIDHCEFGPLSVKGRYIFPCGNATITGVTFNPVVDRGPWAHGLGPYNPNMSRYTQIDHNYFHDHAGSTSESIVLGGIGMTGDYQGTMSLVEYNLFVNCNGDGAEIISTKSSTNTIRYNTVITSAGHISLRSGNGSSVYGNFFLQGGVGGGIKLSEMDHRIYNNYIENTDTSSYPIMLENGDYYTNSSFAHAQVLRCWAVHNTVVNPGRQVLIGHSSTSPLKPTDCVLANNIIKGSGTIYSQDNPTNLVRSQNVIWTQNPGSGFVVADPQFTTVNGLQKLSAGSPAINAADINYSIFVSDDMDGQPRAGVPDIGADEFSAGAILRRPLTTNDVGPNSLDSEFVITAAPGSQTVITGTATNYVVTLTAASGFADTVALAVSNLPPGVSAVFSPPSLGASGASTLTVTTSNSAVAGTYPVTIVAGGTNFSATAAVTLTISDLLVTAAPSSVSVAPGGSTNVVASVSATKGFGGLVTFGVSGLPAGATPTFVPSTITGAGTSTLTIATTSNTVPGTYPLTISATSGGLSANAPATLVVVSPGGTMLWNVGVTPATTNWSAPLNWTNITSGGFGPPGASNDVLFANAGTTAGSNVVTSVVDSDVTINSLLFTNTTGYHNVLIGAGHTLTLAGIIPGYQNSPALNVGMEVPAGAADAVRATVLGADGTLAINNTNACVQVRQGFGSGTGATYASLDLSSLGTFVADMRRLQLGVESSTPRRVAGILYLARTNTITIEQALDVNATNLASGTPALVLGHNTGSGTTSARGSALYLGIQNSIFVNFIVVGRGNQTNNLVAFNPAVLGSNPFVVLRGSDGISRVGQWVIGDNSAGGQTGPSSGTNDFTGGTVDAQVDRLFLGRGRSGNTVNTGFGTLAFGAGTIDANTVRLGTMVDESSSTNASGVGVLTVNGGTLIVNSVLEFGHTNTTALSAPSAITAMRGTLNAIGATVFINGVTAGGGVSTVNVSGGALVISNAIASPGAALTALNVTNAVIHLNVDAAAVKTNIAVATLSAGGTSTIMLDAIANVTGTNTFPVLSYAAANGSVGPHFSLAPLPAGFSGTLVDNAAQKRLDVVIARVPVTPPVIGSIGIAAGGGSVILQGSNGLPNGAYYILGSTNVALPLSNWTILATNVFDSSGQFNWTNAIDPSATGQFYLLQLP
jgi:poly(beta-D-mannuronate) lyase